MGDAKIQQNGCDRDRLKSENMGFRKTGPNMPSKKKDIDQK